ncbi:MAG: response regulator, partial [Bacteroidota bacterium]
LNEFVAEVFIFFKEKAYSRKIDYQFFNLPEAPMVYVDREKLETLLINLLSNAFKFTPSDGTIRIRLEMVGDERAAAIFNQQKEPILNYLRLSIEDSGTGIDPQKRDKIFNPYFQSESPTPFNANGSGIGLALVKSIVQLHHFKIDVADNKKSGGSTFSLRIPLGKAYLSPNELAKNASLASVTPSQAFVETPPFVANFQQSILKVADGITPVKKKLLVVEDHPDIQCYLREHLSQYFKILLAENGKIGFQLAKAEVPDLIISDVMMPEMNGMEMSKRLKTDEQLHHIPIILLTAITSTANELAGLRLGIEDYIRKPFNMELLLAKIGAILDNRQYVQEYYAKMLHFPPSSMNQLTEDDILLQKIIQLINNNLQNELLNVKFICSAMAMGRTKLYTKIKELTGRSIVELVRDIRLKKAGQQLRNTKDTIEQIAFGVGFNDVKYFRTHFKVMYGVNPSAYRKKEVSQ